jgi:flagellar basal-body rod protein FlgG
MISGMFEAINGSLNEELQLSIITNNLANIGVAGFKKDRLSFANIMRASLMVGDSEVTGGNIIQDHQLYRRTVKLEADMRQGTLKHTGNQLDFAISGEGFFKISTPHGIRYTRRGVFHLNEQGMIATSEDYLLLGNNGPISVPNGELVVDKNGGISVDGDRVDTVDLVAFDQPENLEKEGNSLFRLGKDPAEERAPNEQAQVIQGYLEEANVLAAEELIWLLRTERSYEAHQKIIRALHDIDTKAINDAGRVR